MGVGFEILGLSNLLYLKNEWMKFADLHADTNLGNQKVTLLLGVHCQEWVRSYRSWDS